MTPVLISSIPEFAPGSQIRWQILAPFDFRHTETSTSLFVLAVQVPRLRAKTAALVFREQFDSLVKDISSAMNVIRSAVQQVDPPPPLDSR